MKKACVALSMLTLLLSACGSTEQQASVKSDLSGFLKGKAGSVSAESLKKKGLVSIAAIEQGKVQEGGYTFAPQAPFNYDGGQVGALLRGPRGTNFDLHLIRYINNEWNVVASSENSSSKENLKANVEKGTYTFVVSSSSGSGHFQLNYNLDDSGPGNGAPKADFAVFRNGLRVSFTDKSTDDKGVTSWQWDFGNGETSTEKNPVINYRAKGTYEIRLIVKDSDGNTNTITKSVEIAKNIKDGDNPGPGDSAPKADFDVVRNGLRVSFTDKSADDKGVTSWQWDFGNGETSTDKNPVVNYRAKGTYEISLTVKDGDGNTNTKTKSVEIAKNIKDGPVDPPPPPPGEEPDLVYENVTSANWDKIMKISNTRPVLVDFFAPWCPPCKVLKPILLDEVKKDNKKWILATVDTDQAKDLANEFNIELLPTVIVFIDGKATRKEVNPDRAKVRQIMNEAMRQKPVSPGNPNPNPGPGDKAPQSAFTVFRNGLRVSFTDKSTDDKGVRSWLWDFGNGETSTSQNPVVNYRAKGTYTVELTVKDAAGQSNSSRQSVQVAKNIKDGDKPNPGKNQRPVADFSFVANKLNVKFKDKSRDADGKITKWAWDFGNGYDDEIPDPELNYRGPGTFTVKLTVTDDGGAIDTISKQVKVSTNGGGKPDPKPDPKPNPNPNVKPVYDPVTSSNINEVLKISNSRTVILDFGATWCGPCQQLKPLIKAKAKKDKGKWVLGLIDVDQSPGLKNKYKAKKYPTLISIKNGREASRHTTGMSGWERWVNSQIR